VNQNATDVLMRMYSIPLIFSGEVCQNEGISWWLESKS